MRLPGTGHRRKGRLELPMTPMIDIVFNLVIFFLLMPTFEARDGYLPTNLPDVGPQWRAPRPQERPEIRIDLARVEPYGRETASRARILLNREELADFRELRARLRAARDEFARGKVDPRMVSVWISPDMVVWHKHVVAAFDAAIEAGFRRIRFTVPQ